MKIRILSDNPDSAERLRATLAQAGKSMDVAVGHATSSEPLGAVNGTVPDIVVLDAFRPANLSALEQLTLRYPQIDPIVITADTSSDFLLQAFRAGVREVLPTSPSPEALHAALARITRKRGGSAAADGKILALTSCKGGSGATFLATNLAWVLAAVHGKRVALIDLNLQFGDAAMYVTDQKPASNLALVCQQIHRLDAAFLQSAMIEVAPGFHLLAAPDDPAHSIDVRAEHVEAILKVARANYDFVIVDVGRSLDAVSLKPFDMADMIFPVVQLTLPFIREAKRLVEVFVSLGYPTSKVGLVVNRHHKNSDISLQDVERTVKAKLFKTVPNSYDTVAASVNQGEPIGRLAKNSPVTKALREIAESLVDDPEKASKGWLSRLFATH
ncbi:AAA family ATPase [Azoarcus sp. PA01]|nr:AAA family ATPase [Azoarcus sp. PA01]